MRIGWVWVTHDEDEVPVDEVRPTGARGEAAAMRAPRERRRRCAHIPRDARLGCCRRCSVRREWPDARRRAWPPVQVDSPASPVANTKSKKKLKLE